MAENLSATIAGLRSWAKGSYAEEAAVELVYVRTTYTKDRPLRTTLTIFAADRNRVVYELGDLTALHGDIE